MNNKQKKIISQQEKKWRAAAIRDYHRFMAIDATGHQITMFMDRHHMTPGHDLRGCAKSWLAEHFAKRNKITLEHVNRLEEQFGSRDTRLESLAEQRRNCDICKRKSK